MDLYKSLLDNLYYGSPYYEISIFILGAFISWFLNHIYYRKNSSEQKQLFRKLPAEIIQGVLDAKTEKLTIMDLNKLLRQHVIDDSGEGLNRYTKCPKCGSTKLKHGIDYFVDYEPDDFGGANPLGYPYKVVECMSCGWSKNEVDSDRLPYE
jgi:hypothetical protein